MLNTSYFPDSFWAQTAMNKKDKIVPHGALYSSGGRQIIKTQKVEYTVWTLIISGQRKRAGEEDG